MLFPYVRVSTNEQGDGSSPADQERKGRAIAQLRGVGSFDVCVYRDVGVSGSIPLNERPAGKEMLAAAKSGDVIVAAKMDRLFRSAADALSTAAALKKRGIDLILVDMGVDPVTSNGASKMFFGMLALVAEFERERIAERMQDGKRAKRGNGGHAGGKAPYGWRIAGKGREARLVEIPQEQRVLRRVKELIATSDPDFLKVGRIKNELAIEGIRSRSGEPFVHEQVQRLVDRARSLGEVHG